MTARDFPTVWFATAERVSSATKLVVFDDKGSLRIEPNGSVSFEGSRRRIRVDSGRICEVALVRQTINWVVYLVLDAALGVFLYVNGWSIEGILVVCVASTVLGVLVGANTKWVKIAWKEPGGSTSSAFFAHAGGFGWSGIGGGTADIHAALAPVVRR